MVKKLLLFLLIITFINSQFPIEDSCQKIECSKSLDSDVCIEVQFTTSFFKECANDEICDIDLDDPVQNSKCIKNTKKIKRLPSLSCKSNEDCLSENCKEDICVGKLEGETCFSVEDCEYGYTCRKDKDGVYKCLDPITTGNKCDYDTDCVNESGCLNNICTKYFSLENNQQSRDLNNGELSFCKSGYSNELGICQNLTLINDNYECSQNNKCKYNSSIGEIITIDSNCLCGYNPESKRYCLLGSGNDNYTIYLNKLKNYYLFNKNCHLSERNSEGCQKDLFSGDKYILNKIQELINAKYWAISNNKLIKAPECVFKVELPDYDRSLDSNYEPEPLPGEGSCAIYKCEESGSKEFCAQSNFKNGFNINVKLYDICSDDVSCKIGGDPNEVFYNKTNINSKCYSTIENKRYPGEKCEVDTECVYPLNNPSSQFHKCEDGRCNGMDENGICEDNSWCLAGYYCDKYSGKCKEQKQKDENCLDSKECQNDLICLNSKCSEELFSLENGAEVPEKEDIEIQKKFCKNGEVYDSVCVGYNDFEAKVDDDKYKKCNFGEKCTYNVTGLNYKRKLEILCPCGYNAEGQGYCPHFHEYSTKDWEEYRNILKKNYNNECHTENRYNCYETKEMDKEKELKNSLEKGHLFYNSVTCAKKVLDGRFLFVKKISILLGLILVLL